MEWKRLELGPIGTNCYILYEQNNGVIVDPGGDSDEIIDTLTSLEVAPEAILLTHAHFDHIGAVEKIRNYYQIPVYLHDAEWEWPETPTLNGSAYFPVGTVTAGPADHRLKEGELLLQHFRFEVKHTPGHSPGSVSFINHENKLAISGDALFKQGIGRTDLAGGNMEELLASIEEKLFSLSGEFLVLPGHGPVTKIGDERVNNPFFS